MQPNFAPLSADRPSLTDQVAAAIRDAAQSGQLLPGELYSAYQISDLLGVSRGPVREAIMRLAESGMIRIERNKGFRLVVPDAREIAEIFHIRLLLEVPAARRAAERRTEAQLGEMRSELKAMAAASQEHDESLFMTHDRRLHSKILHASRNDRLVTTIGALREATRVLGASTVERSRSLEDVYAEHLPVVTAIADRDAAAAGRAMREHVHHTGRLLVSQALRTDNESADLNALWDEVVGPEEPT